jgi:hypothetical protein
MIMFRRGYNDATFDSASQWTLVVRNIIFRMMVKIDFRVCHKTGNCQEVVNERF